MRSGLDPQRPDDHQAASFLLIPCPFRFDRLYPLHPDLQGKPVFNVLRAVLREFGQRRAPGAESQREFYAEKPIQLRMVGTYHQFGAFMSGVASLPRVVIMTMHDIQLKPRDSGQSALVLEGTVKTYRYLDEDEEAGGGSTGEVQ